MFECCKVDPQNEHVEEGLFVRPVTALDSEIVGTIEPIPNALHPDALAYQEHRETDAFLAEWMTAVRNETEVVLQVLAAGFVVVAPSVGLIVTFIAGQGSFCGST